MSERLLRGFARRAPALSRMAGGELVLGRREGGKVSIVASLLDYAPHVVEEVGAPFAVSYDAPIGLPHALGDAELGAEGVVLVVCGHAAHVPTRFSLRTALCGYTVSTYCVPTRFFTAEQRSGTMKVYERTENGATTHVSIRQGLDEINTAMMGGRRGVRTMSSISHTGYAIEYKDGRSVRLVQVDAPAPEGFTQGQAVVVQRPGQPPITGTVAHIHTAPGYVAVLDDRHRAVSNYPTRCVSAVEAEEEHAELEVNVVSYRGGKVHTQMPGLDGQPWPLCRGGANQMLTKFQTTNAPLSCTHCVEYARRRAVRVEGDR